MQGEMKSNNKNNSEKLLHKKKLLQIVEDCNDEMNLHRKKQKQNLVHDYCSMDVLERAEEIHSSLQIAFPSLIKPMMPSHVSGCFWLGLPRKFCSSHLPKVDTTITLEDENGENYETKYLPHKLGLSGGWRGFALAHNLVEGDVVVFQLVKPTTFKVYIVRLNQSAQVDEPTGLLERDHSSNESASDAESNSETKSETMLVDKDNTDAVVSNNVMGFKHPTSSNDFTIVVDGTIIDSEIPNHLKVKYYALCCSQGENLHKTLVKGLNLKLVAGIISETVNISDAIRTSKITDTTYSEKLPKWEKTLNSFKDLGMEVGFLLARVKKLMKLETESQRLNDARMERSRVEKEKIEFEVKIKKLDVEIKKLEKRHKSMFHHTASAPW